MRECFLIERSKCDVIQVNAKMIGTASIALAKDRLKGLPMEGSRQMLHFKNKEKEVGQF